MQPEQQPWSRILLRCVCRLPDNKLTALADGGASSTLAISLSRMMSVDIEEDIRLRTGNEGWEPPSSE